jgi:hypothetical protein
MRYIRNQFVRSGSFMWWIFIFLIAGTFLWWGIFVLQWSWTGIFPIFIGISILFRLIIATSNRSKIRNIVLDEFGTRPEASIKDISMRTGISRRDVRAIILDLKASGHFIGKFSTKTGQNHLLIQSSDNSIEEFSKYCHNCGAQNKESAQYCSYCGTRI